MNISTVPEPRKRRRKGEAPERAQGKAAVYIRVSVAEQAATTESGSLASQGARCRALCDARGLEVAQLFVDDGASGGTVDRPGLDALRRFVANGGAAVVVVYSVDRLSRSQRDTIGLLEEFESHGAGLAAASQPFDTTAPAGRAMLGMLAVFAELQRAEIRERTRVALARKKRDGEAVGRTPFGLEREGPGFRPDPASWPIVERVLTERAGGSTCQQIADRLNQDRILTPTAMRRERRGLVRGPGRWHAGSVARICANQAIRAVAGRTEEDPPRPVGVLSSP